MSYIPTEKEAFSVARIKGSKRYEYTIKRVADFQELWSLRDRAENWCLGADDDGTEAVPVWPAESYARKCCTGKWLGFEPAPIELALWRERWTPGMARDGRRVAVFPVGRGKAVCVEPARFMMDIEEDLKKIE
jgi:hypothetical protein